jgi:hypothetical protein
MEVVAGEVQRRHLGVADLDALLVDAGIEGALDLQSGFCGRCADQLDDDGEAIGQGRPRQFCVMWQNMRCSILFHFDVPGG